MTFKVEGFTLQVDKLKEFSKLNGQVSFVSKIHYLKKQSEK